MLYSSVQAEIIRPSKKEEENNCKYESIEVIFVSFRTGNMNNA